MTRLRASMPPTLFALALVGAWEAYVRARGVADYVLPAPSRVWRALWSMAPDLGDDVQVTITEAVLGLLAGATAGVVLALAIAAWPVARRAVYPVLVVSQTVPVIVLAPILTVWLGFTMAPKIVVVALVTFFPVVVSTVDGLVHADRELVDLVRSFGASRPTVLRVVQVPHALPGFFAGLKIAASYAVVGAVIAEWMGASQGLGLAMMRAFRVFRTDRVLAVVVVVAAASVTLFFLVHLVARLAMPWRAAETRPEVHR